MPRPSASLDSKCVALRKSLRNMCLIMRDPSFTCDFGVTIFWAYIWRLFENSMFVPSHLGPAHADDAVDVPVGVVEEGHGDGMFAGRDPVPLGAGVDLENVGPGAEDRLLPGGGHAGDMMRYDEIWKMLLWNPHYVTCFCLKGKSLMVFIMRHLSVWDSAIQG